VEQRKKTTASPVADASGCLLLMEEEWTARMKAKEKRGSRGGGGRGRGRGRGRGCGSGRSRNGGNGEDSNSNSHDGRESGGGHNACHNYGKMGHWARQCRCKGKKAEAHVAQDDELSLLLMEPSSVESRIETFTPPPAATVVDLISPEKLEGADGEQSRPSTFLVHGAKAVHLVEEKVLAYFSDEEKIECCRWMLDTGATNHMVGCKIVFSYLD
jgi:ribosomal protein L15